MTLLFGGYEFLPALYLNFFVWVAVRIGILFTKEKTGQLPRSILTAGFISFFFFIPLSIYEPTHELYAMVPIVSFIQFLFGCFLFMTSHPKEFATSFALTSTPTASSSSPAVPQSIEEAAQLVYSALLPVEQPFHTYKDTTLTFHQDHYKYPVVALSARGVYQIFPCNWGGVIRFTNTSTQREIFQDGDVMDHTVLYPLRKRLLKDILRSVGMEATPIHTIVCITNPSAQPMKQANDYSVVTPEELTELLQNGHPTFLKGSELNDLKLVIDNSVTTE